MLNELMPLATYCFLMSSTPGPNNVMLTASGANFGYRDTLPHIMGIRLGNALQVLLTCLGLGALFIAVPALQAALRIGGAAYLLWLAWKLGGSGMAEAHLPRPMSFTQAALVQHLNPKSWMKAVTLAAVFMPAGWAPTQAALCVVLIDFAVGFPCISAWALFGMAIRRALVDARRRRAFNVIMAASLAWLALRFLF